MAKRRNLDLDGPFVLHSLEMRESLAWRALSNNGRRVLDRLEVEHMAHGGGENGNLICTYDDFCAVGIHRNYILRAIEECAALGFLEVTAKGGLALRGFRRPSRYRLTYLMGRSKSPDPTHEWKAKSRELKNFFPSIKNATAACSIKNATAAPESKTILAQREPRSIKNATAIYISGGCPQTDTVVRSRKCEATPRFDPPTPL